jgi:hypothetical protein
MGAVMAIRLGSTLRGGVSQLDRSRTRWLLAVGSIGSVDQPLDQVFAADSTR